MNREVNWNKKSFFSAMAGIFSILSLPCIPSFAQAAPGDLDSSFGVGGKVVSAFTSDFDQIEDVVIQVNEKILVAGFSLSGAGFNLARYKLDGSLDTTFGNMGKVSTNFNCGSPARAHALAIQTDGKIVAAGDCGGSYYAAARYSADGVLDTRFGTKGKVIFYTGSEAQDVVIQSNGQIVLAGGSLARLNSNGKIDNTFGNGGIVTTANINHHAVAIQMVGTEERIVAAGEVFVGGTTDFSLVRYHSTNGSIDTSFGLNGITTTSLGPGFDRAFDIVVYYPFNASIVVAGHADDSIGFRNIALARYDLNGNIDTWFGSNGKVITAAGSGHSEAFALSLDQNSNYLVSGYAERISGETVNTDFAVLRYHGNNGDLDTSFGNQGVVMTDFGGDSFESAYGIVIQPVNNQSRILAVGRTSPTGDGASYDFALSRYLP